MTDSSEANRTSNNVYVLHSSAGWLPGRVTSTTETHATVQLTPPSNLIIDSDDSSDEESSIPSSMTVRLSSYPSSTLPLQNVDERGHLIEVPDMVDLPYLHEAAILYNLRLRHETGVPYTRTGDIVIAVNPYEWMDGLYSEEKRNSYAEQLIWNDLPGGDPKSTIEPHVYETSSLAYRGLAVESHNQSILVSGESGAGKTETVKILMSHLASVQALTLSDSPGSSSIVKRVLDSNPLLEAFGNAKTCRNDNSSRFGKFIQLQFDAEDPTIAAYSGKSIPSCILAGSMSCTYLLEKSRVVGHVEEERNFHIFYQLLAAPEATKAEIWDGLCAKGNEDYKYVGFTETDTIEGKLDGERWELTVEALSILGVEKEQLYVLARALCVVLQLGNLEFSPDPANEENGKITSEAELSDLANLMGLEVAVINKALTTRTVKAQRDEYEVPLNHVAAKNSTDAFAKEIYAQSFNWLVRTINLATCAENNYDDRANVKKFGLIGLLDIFGFESFVVNRFEQLCINYANEKLQQKFTVDIFRSVQEEYEFEGIAMSDITFEDNADVLNLVEGRMGLIAVLNEECVRPRGNDTSFVSKINAMNKESDCLIQDKFFRPEEFGVHHYAGPVIYDATNFVFKNKDTLPLDLLVCASKSTNDLIHKEFSALAKPPPTKSKSKSIRRGASSLVSKTVWTKFRSQLTELMTSIGETKTRYIRCIKPNKFKAPRKMSHVSTIEQLRCAGVVAAITISRSSFPNRLELSITLERFHCLLLNYKKEHTDNRLEVESVLTKLLKHMEVAKNATDTDTNTVVKAFTCGKTRVYFRAGALEFLEAQRLVALGDRAINLQRIVRGFLVHRRFRFLRMAVICAQAHARSVIARKQFIKIRLCCIDVQCWVRITQAKDELTKRSRDKSATIIQNHWRMVRAYIYRITCIQAVVTVQKIARGARQRPIYREAIKEAKEEAKLENQVKTLQRKLQEAENRRPAAGADEVVTTKIVYIEKNQENKSEPTITAQQQALMDESGKMLEYLRKEVFKLRSQNSQLKGDFDIIKESNQRLMDANASAGASFAALNQHAKHLSKTNTKLMADMSGHKQQVSKLNLAQIELKEELKMKQATYIAEVHSRLQYQKTMTKIVDVVTARCMDDHLVDHIINMSDDCESDYMAGPTGINVPGISNTPQPRAPPPRSGGIFGGQKEHFNPDPPPTPQPNIAARDDSRDSISGKLFSFFTRQVTSQDVESPNQSPAAPMTPLKGMRGLQTVSGAFTET